MRVVGVVVLAFYPKWYEVSFLPPVLYSESFSDVYSDCCSYLSQEREAKKWKYWRLQPYAALIVMLLFDKIPKFCNLGSTTNLIIGLF